MWIAGNGEKMEDICLCFRHFPQFKKDLPALLSDEGAIKRIAFDHYKWTDTETSLAEYFYWLGEEKRKKEERNQLNMPDGFWDTIETVFKINRRTLSNLASRSKKRNPLKPGETKKFKMIKKIVEDYRKELEKQEEQKRKDAEQEQKDMETFTAIKTIISNANGDDIKEIRTIFEKIKTALDFPLCEKCVQKISKK
jgi:hypothetical protein